LPPSARLHTVRLSSHCLFGDAADHSSPIIQAPSAPPGIPTRIGVGSAAIPRIEAAGVPGIKADTGCDCGPVERSTPAPIGYAARIGIERPTSVARTRYEKTMLHQPQSATSISTKSNRALVGDQDFTHDRIGCPQRRVG
jgi:hypothetical protein